MTRAELASTTGLSWQYSAGANSLLEPGNWRSRTMGATRSPSPPGRWPSTGRRPTPMPLSLLPLPPLPPLLHLLLPRKPLLWPQCPLLPLLFQQLPVLYLLRHRILYQTVQRYQWWNWSERIRQLPNLRLGLSTGATLATHPSSFFLDGVSKAALPKATTRSVSWICKLFISSFYGHIACIWYLLLHFLYLFSDLHIFSSAWKHVLGVLCSPSQAERSGQNDEESGAWGSPAAWEAGFKTEEYGIQVGESKILSCKIDLSWWLLKGL